MEAKARTHGRYLLLLALALGCGGSENDVALPRTFQLGQPVEALRPQLADDCRSAEELHYVGEMAAPFEEQTQINCSGLDVLGALRDVEFMFNDGPLGHVWIHVGAEELTELQESLEKTYGEVVHQTEIYRLFACETVALRLDPPEVLVATPDIIAELTGYRAEKQR